MSATNEGDMLMKSEAILNHMSKGGTLKTLVDMGEKEMEAIYAVAYNHLSANKYDQAIDLFKFLCLYDHTEARWFYGLGVAQQRKGAHESAVNSYGMATILDVDNPRPQAQAGYCLLALGRWPEAASALEGAIMVCGDTPEHAAIKRQAEAMLQNAKAKAAGNKGEKA